ncbi:MAG: hypothetical protein EPN91_08735 [Salinibacterium sp.]|nr:MAG: hypothetical protein EPN91_08735 [Salinibacterium sp.]
MTTTKLKPNPKYEELVNKAVAALKCDLLVNAIRGSDPKYHSSRDLGNCGYRFGLSHAAYVKRLREDPRRVVTVEQAKQTKPDREYLEVLLTEAAKKNDTGDQPGYSLDALSAACLTAVLADPDAFTVLYHDNRTGKTVPFKVGERYNGERHGIGGYDRCTVARKAEAEVYFKSIEEAAVAREFKRIADGSTKTLTEELGYPDVFLATGDGFLKQHESVIEMTPDTLPDPAKTIEAVWKLADEADAKVVELQKRSRDLRSIASAIKSDPAKLAEYHAAVLEAARENVKRNAAR